jgi:hypothetical protein
MKENMMTRRTFLITLGKIGVTAISGWVIPSSLKSIVKVVSSSNLSVECPALKSGLELRAVEDGVQIFDRKNLSHTKPRCFVNAAGYSVIKLLNGKNGLENISRHLLGDKKVTVAEVDKCTAGIAQFVAELGMAGLLKAPFHVEIVNAEVKART